MAIKHISTTADYIDFDRALNRGFKIIKEEKNKILGLYIVISINTGLRVSDVLILKWDDLSGDKLNLIEKKTKKKRSIQINNHIKKALTHFKYQDENENIFLSQKGTVYSIQQINRLLKSAFSRESKNLRISSHSLRKTMGRRVWEQNNQSEQALVYLSELFQHSSVSITRRYLGIRQEELDNIYLNL